MLCLVLLLVVSNTLLKILRLLLIGFASQMTSKNPKAFTCILDSFHGWLFPECLEAMYITMTAGECEGQKVGLEEGRKIPPV